MVLDLKCESCNRKYDALNLKFCPNCGYAKLFSKNGFEEAQIIRPKILDISNKINNLRTKYTNEEFPYNDIRNQTLGSTFTILKWIHDQLDVYSQLYATPSSPGAAKIIQDNPNMKKTSVRRIIFSFWNDFKKLFFIPIYEQN